MTKSRCLGYEACILEIMRCSAEARGVEENDTVNFPVLLGELCCLEECQGRKDYSWGLRDGGWGAIYFVILEDPRNG